MKSQFRVGDVATIRETGESGVVLKVDKDGQPVLLKIGKKVVEVVDKILDKAPLLIQLWFLLKAIFKRG